ncbi:MAG: type IV pili methyl-accepting chemotaxis transducer N-terminal domain-containing protein [Gammaproteobacteria bacterium]|nr:type IV pili methyl-accepting chemotaxis transducer N-terminal domain-containing protein [Gammaproteobacteria bacterium]
MVRLFEKSLLMRLGLAMATITALAFLGMLSSVFIAETSEGQAAAINQAGTLRMQSYRIASALAHTPPGQSAVALQRAAQLIDEFEQRLHSRRLTGVLSKAADQQLLLTYDKVNQQWQQQIRPLLDTYISLAGKSPQTQENLQAVAGLRTNYLQAVGPFVATIDEMVKVLELEAEDNIQQLRLIQIASLFLTILVVSITMYMMHTNVLAPLRDLLGCASAVRRGDFSRRTRLQSEDELGQLAYTFNLMAEDLSKIYSDLENRVREKTVDLEHRNQSLELLYKTTRRLSEVPLHGTAYEELLEDIRTLVGTGPGTICLGESGTTQAFKLASIRPDVFDKPDICNPPDCQACFGNGNPHIVTVAQDSEHLLEVFSTPIKDNGKQYGVLLVELPQNRLLEPWQQRLLETVASHIAIALNIARHHSQDRMLALLEERGVIARELHDSLAQSLSYLKIQVSRLDAALLEPCERNKIAIITGELREGLNSAYRQLRELLTTFRLRIDEAGLNSALQKTVQEFSERSQTEITLQNRLGNCKLTPNAEIHVIQIVREALSNVLRHSQAHHAVVSAEYTIDGDVIIAIDDDGIGLPQGNERPHHYGLTIMKERALGLCGALCILPSEMGGTRVELSFSAAGKWRCKDALLKTTPGRADEQ